MSVILAIDPSIASSGFAVFRDGVLVHAGRVVMKSDTGRDPAVRERDMAQRIGIAAFGSGPAPMLTLVSERPQLYQRERGKSKADPNLMLFMVGVTASLAASLGGDVKTYRPAEWKGQRTKEAVAHLVRHALQDVELRCLEGANHDTIEATGIGMFFLGRFRPVRVYPGAT